MKDNETFFRNLVELAQCMIVVLRQSGTITYLNAYARELTGSTPEEVLGENFFERFVPQPDRATVEQHFRRVVADLSGQVVEHPLVAEGAPSRWVETSFRPMTDGNGRLAVLLTSRRSFPRCTTRGTTRAARSARGPWVTSTSGSRSAR